MSLFFVFGKGGMADTAKDPLVRLSFARGDAKNRIAAIKNEIKTLARASRRQRRRAKGRKPEIRFPPLCHSPRQTALRATRISRRADTGASKRTAPSPTSAGSGLPYTDR